jgi:phage-related protein
MTYDYINFSCTLDSVYGTPGLYATLTDCENAVNDGSVKPVLILNPLWSASKKATLPLIINKLGDGYQQTVFQGIDLINKEWSITSPVLIETQVNDFLNQLRVFLGTSFLWSPNNGVIDYQEFTCDEWQKIRLGANQYQLTTTFKMTILGSGLLIPYIPPTPSGDPHANNVVLFLKGDGTNGSTNIIDSSPSPKTISVFGNAQISTAQSKYGGSSLLFDGSGDYLTATPLNLVNVDFTVEYWIYVLTTKRGVILSSYNNPNQVGTFITHTNSNGAIAAQNGIFGIDTPAITNNSWIHVAATYQQSSNQLKIYLNGVLSQSISVTINDQHSTCWIGGAPNDNNIGGWWLHAYVDSLRVTRGVVRYTANFNPETDTYLNV